MGKRVVLSKSFEKRLFSNFDRLTRNIASTHFHENNYLFPVNIIFSRPIVRFRDYLPILPRIFVDPTYKRVRNSENRLLVAITNISKYKHRKLREKIRKRHKQSK